MKEQIKYPVLSARIEQELKDWLMKESLNFRSWNLFFRELRSRYENEVNNK